MSRIRLRGRAITTMLACAGLALSPAVATAAAKTTKRSTKKHHKLSALKEARNTQPAARHIVAAAPSTSSNGLGSAVGVNDTLQLAAMRTAINAAPGFYTGRTTGCTTVTALLTSQSGQIMAGNFRDTDGNCYVWLNLQQSSMLTGSEICKTTLHEMGHLNGLQHSPDPNDVMYSPFRSNPIPAPCAAPTTKSSLASLKAKTSSVSI